MSETELDEGASAVAALIPAKWRGGRREGSEPVGAGVWHGEERARCLRLERSDLVLLWFEVRPLHESPTTRRLAGGFKGVSHCSGTALLPLAPDAKCLHSLRRMMCCILRRVCLYVYLQSAQASDVMFAA